MGKNTLLTTFSNRIKGNVESEKPVKSEGGYKLIWKGAPVVRSGEKRSEIVNSAFKPAFRFIFSARLDNFYLGNITINT